MQINENIPIHINYFNLISRHPLDMKIRGRNTQREIESILHHLYDKNFILMSRVKEKNGNENFCI